MSKLEEICHHEICKSLGITKSEDKGPLFMYNCLRCESTVVEKIKGEKYDEFKVRIFNGIYYTLYKLKFKEKGP